MYNIVQSDINAAAYQIRGDIPRPAHQPGAQQEPADILKTLGHPSPPLPPSTGNLQFVIEYFRQRHIISTSAVCWCCWLFALIEITVGLSEQEIASGLIWNVYVSQSSVSPQNIVPVSVAVSALSSPHVPHRNASADHTSSCPTTSSQCCNYGAQHSLTDHFYYKLPGINSMIESPLHPTPCPLPPLGPCCSQSGQCWQLGSGSTGSAPWR